MIKPDLQIAIKEQARIKSLDKMIEEAINTVEILDIKCEV